MLISGLPLYLLSVLSVSKMPPKKRDSLGRVDPKTKKKRWESRANEIPQQREAGLESNRQRSAESRAAETTEQREATLEGNRLRVAGLKAAETSEQREQDCGKPSKNCKVKSCRKIRAARGQK